MPGAQREKPETERSGKAERGQNGELSPIALIIGERRRKFKARNHNKPHVNNCGVKLSTPTRRQKNGEWVSGNRDNSPIPIPYSSSNSAQANSRLAPAYEVDCWSDSGLEDDAL